MSKLFDALTRSLLEKYPADWLNQLGLIHGEPVRVMNSDLSSVTAEADKVIRVEGPQPWLVHIELQAGYDRTLPRRLLRYNAMLNVKHDLPVHTVAILLHPGADGPELTGVLRQQSPDGRCRLEFCYHLVRAWQWDTEAILTGGVGMLPLAPLSARELDQIPIIVERLKERVDPAAVTAEISELWTSAAVMAGLRFPWELIKHCFGGITAMRESSTIQAFLEEGRVKGLAEEARRFILRQGRIRFGEAGDTVVSRLDSISDLEKLEQLGERLLIVSSWDQLLGQEEPWSRGIPDMEESSTIRAFIEEGRRKGREEVREERRAGEARKIILRLGRKRLGAVDETVVSRLEAISDLEQLEQLVERLFTVSSWDELLSGE